MRFQCVALPPPHNSAIIAVLAICIAYRADYVYLFFHFRKTYPIA